MNVLFSNAPWFDGKDKFFKFLNVDRVGVRGGSRWPFTFKRLKFPLINFKQLFIGPYRYPFDYIPPPYFLMSTSSYVDKALGIKSVIRDSIVRRESYSEYLNYLGSNNFEYIFLESATSIFEHDRKLLKDIINKTPNSKIVICGTLSRNEFEFFLNNYSNVVAVISGEFEKNSLKVLNGETGYFDHNLMTKQEMNDAPHPKWDEGYANKYYDINPRGGDHPRMHLLASRGCPFKCNFCVWPSVLTGNDPNGDKPRTVRYYSPEFLEPFIRKNLKDYHFKSLWFDDDTFNLGTAQTLRMCEMLKKINIPWYAMCRADTVKKEIWKEMRDSGCRGVKIGVESGDQYINDHVVNKNLDLEITRETVHYLHELGVKIHGTFTVGHPGETLEQMKKTIDFSKSLPFSSVQISGIAELSDTPLSRLEQMASDSRFKGQKDESYVHSNDGNKKFIDIAKKLRVSGPLT